MPIGELCVRQVVIASRDTSVLDAARLMRHHHVGDIVVTEESNGRRVPVGIVTDRDMVLEVLAEELDPRRISVGDIMTGELVTVRESEETLPAIQYMRAKGVRRVPVVSGDGGLAGILAVDDLLELLAEEMGELAKLIAREQKREAELRR
ncbi:MAG: CBS domain-containing protein [Bryobacterales bacterium]|nr:CBS domain-containing protein [Bryobacterales bacterium]